MSNGTLTKTDGVKSWLTSETLKTQVSQALPDGISTDRFLRCLFTQVQKNPKLLACSKETLLTAIIGCGQLGIEPDGRRAHLIPYGSACQLIIDYKGLVELVMRSGKIKRIHADVVCDNDVFETDKGIILKHVVEYRKSRGNAFAVYALAEFEDGTEKAEILTYEDVEAIRKKSKSQNVWSEHWQEMAKKTAFRRLAKWLPLETSVYDAIEAEDGPQTKAELVNVTETEIMDEAFAEQQNEEIK